MVGLVNFCSSISGKLLDWTHQSSLKRGEENQNIKAIVLNLLIHPIAYPSQIQKSQASLKQISEERINDPDEELVEEENKEAIANLSKVLLTKKEIEWLKRPVVNVIICLIGFFFQPKK